MKLRYYSHEEDFVSSSIEIIEQAYKRSIGGFYVGLSGGKTPIPVYKALTQNELIDFSDCHFFVTDERYVPHDHGESNTRMIQNTLLSPLGDDVRSLNTFDTSLSIEASLALYEKKLKTIPRSSLDLMILGIGTDGHIASIFSGSQAMHERERLVAHTTATDFPVKDRLTMTAEMIRRARYILVLLSGEAKKDIVEQGFLNKPVPANLPLQLLHHHPDVTVQYHYK